MTSGMNAFPFILRDLAVDDFGHYFGFASGGPTFDCLKLFTHDSWRI
jgi:hypothetical protein